MQQESPVYVAGAESVAGAALLRNLRRQGFRRVLGGGPEAPDLQDRQQVDAFFREYRPAWVFHAAGPSGGIQANRLAPATLCAENLAASLHLIEAAHRFGTRRLLYLASACCYPRHAAQPLTTEALWSGRLEQTSAPYSAARLAGLALCQAHRQQHGRDFRVVIPATTFGPGDHFDEQTGHVVPSLMARLHAAREQGRQEVVAGGTGTPLRELIFADDLADACLFVMRLPQAPDVLNLGSGQVVSIAELADLIAGVVGYRGRIVFDASRPDGAPRKDLCSAALRALGWQRAKPLRQALEATYAWYVENKAAHTRPAVAATALPPESYALDATLYRELYRIRRVEQEIARAYPSDRITSPVHLSIGQEAVSVGVCQALAKDDVVFGSYRSHAYFLAKGGSLPGMMAELYGKATGVAKGKAGSMHLVDPAAGVMGASAVVASTIPQAVGYALAMKLRREARVVAVFFGEGATEEGVFYESLNLATLKKLPILFVCENNAYAIHSRQRDRQATSEICQRARAHGLVTESFPDLDVYHLYARACQAVEELRSSQSAPVLFECHCYRWLEHVGPNEDFAAGYRLADEAAPWVAADPFNSVAARLPQAVRRSLEQEVEEEIHAAFDFAERSPHPDPSELYADLYA